MEQKLAQVDDLEELHLKHLDNQQDELQRHTDNLKSVVHFTEKVLEDDREGEYVCDVLLSIDKRVDELAKHKQTRTQCNMLV